MRLHLLHACNSDAAMGNAPSSLAKSNQKDDDATGTDYVRIKMKDIASIDDPADTSIDDMTNTFVDDAINTILNDDINTNIVATSDTGRDDAPKAAAAQAQNEPIPRAQTQGRKRPRNSEVSINTSSGDMADNTNMVDTANSSNNDTPETATVKFQDEPILRAQPRKKKRPRSALTRLSRLPKKLRYLPTELKLAMHETFKMYAPASPLIEQENSSAATSQESLLPGPPTPPPRYTFLVKQARPTHHDKTGRKLSKRRPHIAIYPEVLSTHATGWDANLAVLQLLHEHCDRAAWEAGTCTGCGRCSETEIQKKVFWNIDGVDGCLRAGFAESESPDSEAESDDSKKQEDGCGDENETLDWQGWVVERHEVQMKG